MSQHPPHQSDRAAAYRGLILGAIALGILLFTIVQLTHRHFADAGKTSSVSVTGGYAMRLDS